MANFSALPLADASGFDDAADCTTGSYWHSELTFHLSEFAITNHYCAMQFGIAKGHSRFPLANASGFDSAAILLKHKLQKPGLAAGGSLAMARQTLNWKSRR